MVDALVDAIVWAVDNILPTGLVIISISVFLGIGTGGGGNNNQGGR